MGEERLNEKELAYLRGEGEFWYNETEEESGMNEAGKFLEGYEVKELLRRLRLKVNRNKVAKLVSVVLELNSAFDKGSFFSILDRNFCWADMDLPKRKEVCEVLINISETWGNEKLPHHFIINDDGSIQDEPCLIDVSEEKLKLNSNRKEWLSEWFHGKGELSKEEAKKVQKKTKRELDWEFGKKEMEKPEVKKAFELAEERGYIKKKDGEYEWARQKSLLGFFLGLLICGDSVNRSGQGRFKPTLIPGGRFRSVYFQELFGDNNIGRYRRDLIKGGTVPENCEYEEIEKIVRDAKATV